MEKKKRQREKHCMLYLTEEGYGYEPCSSGTEFSWSFPGSAWAPRSVKETRSRYFVFWWGGWKWQTCKKKNEGSDLKRRTGPCFWCQIPKGNERKVSKAHVAVAGLGGLGSNIAVMLARSGWDIYFLVDFDTVDVTNLNRQMYMIPHLGRPKAEALPDILCQINPYLKYESVCTKVTPENIKNYLKVTPIVCEAFDRPDLKAMLVRELLSQFSETIVVSGNGMAGFGDTQ